MDLKYDVKKLGTRIDALEHVGAFSNGPLANAVANGTAKPVL